jgi:hypothetical protein
MLQAPDLKVPTPCPKCNAVAGYPTVSGIGLTQLVLYLIAVAVLFINAKR